MKRKTATPLASRGEGYNVRTLEEIRGGIMVTSEPSGWRWRVDGFEPPGLNGNSGLLRMHWTDRKRLATKLDLLLAAARPHPRFDGKVRVSYFRSYFNHPLDEDNLAASVKVALDALVRAKVIEDDSPQFVRLECSQGARAGSAPHFTVQLEPEP